jgi:ABC-type Fe3+ transport system substrate-binding protein
VWSGQRNGWPVDLTYIRHDVPNASGPESRIGAMTLPNTAALIAGGPNADNAERLVEFLFSEDVERTLAESASRNIPVRATVNAAYPDLVVPDVAPIDFRAVSEEMAQAMEIVDRTLPR